MINQNIEDGIERYIKHVRKVSLLTDDQIKMMIYNMCCQNPDTIGIVTDMDLYVKNIRQVSSFSDEQLRSNLRNAAGKDPALQDVFEDAAQKKLFSDMKDIAKDIKSDPRKFARKVDGDTGFNL